MSITSPCPWCIQENFIVPFVTNWCTRCGHAADRSREQCDCATCQTVRRAAEARIAKRERSLMEHHPKLFASNSRPADSCAKLYRVHQLNFPSAEVSITRGECGLELMVRDNSAESKWVRIVLTLDQLDKWLRLLSLEMGVIDNAEE